MLSHTSKRNIGYLRAVNRHLRLRHRSYHPWSSLLGNVEPRKRRLLPALARANATFALQTRGLQASSIPKLLFKAFRVPASGVAVITAGFAYVNYKVQGSYIASRMC